MTYTPEQISQIVLKVLKEIESPDVLTLSRDEKLKLARHPNTPVESLSVLATDENSAVRYWVARNPNTSVESLKVLATDEDPDVRCEVARHPNTPVEDLKVLATDENSDVRFWVARHPNYKPKTLELTPKQYDALKQLIESSQNEILKGILDT